jgi:IS5 family transposase
MIEINFLAENKRLQRLSEMGDPLEKVAEAVDWELFRPTLENIYSHRTYNNGRGGRRPWDTVLMFKILLLQEWNNIADDHTEYLINDRLSYQRFLGIGLGDKVPDAKTIWAYRETLAKSGRTPELFRMFEKALEARGVITRRGSIIDATFAEAPKQRNTRDENKTVKSGGIPEGWQEPGNAAKLSQKDTDARWTKKNGETHYGYKDHVKVDRDSKMIASYAVTDASVHDSQAAAGLVDKKDKCVHMDSAYSGETVKKGIRKKNESIRLSVQEKGTRGNPLTKRQRYSNRIRSKIRSRVEHVFGHMKVSMGGIYIRSIGITRAACHIGLKNLAYNIHRLVILKADKDRYPQLQGVFVPKSV